MSFEIDNALAQMVDAMKVAVGESAQEMEKFALAALAKQKAALEELTQARLDGDLDDEEFEDEIKREMLVMETELLTLTVMGKALVQKAINAAIAALTTIVKGLL